MECEGSGGAVLWSVNILIYVRWMYVSKLHTIVVSSLSNPIPPTDVHVVVHVTLSNIVGNT